MLVLDLQWLVFVCLLVLIAAMWATRQVDRQLRHRARRRLAFLDLEETYPALEQLPFGLLILYGPNGYHYANSTARRLLGLPSPSGQLPETAVTELLQKDRLVGRQTRTTVSRYYTTLVSSSQTEGWIASDLMERANWVVQWWVTALEGRDLVFLLDATTQKRAEEATRSLINDLSHELRTPLATILTHLEVLSLSTLPPEVAQQSVRLLKAEAQRMVRLVQQMLELSRLETSLEIERRPVDLLELVEEIEAQIAPLAEERKIALSLEADRSLPLVVGDSDRLRQLFLNLLDNAVKYCRPGDRVAVRLRREGAGVRCVIRDSGPGIPARHLPHLTRRFYRAGPAEAAGSGLGLALVAEILRRHQSSLEFESRTDGVDTGTVVRFLLPALPVTPATSGKA